MADESADIKTALDLWKREDKRKWLQNKDGMIKELWRQLGNIKVKCPNCENVMSVQTVKSKRCVLCGKSFRIYPPERPSRVIWCPPGKLPILRNIHSLETKGVFESIL